ncbi:hypothetical protein HK405_004343, partial [Cladochytrium tenue]
MVSSITVVESTASVASPASKRESELQEKPSALRLPLLLAVMAVVFVMTGLSLLKGASTTIRTALDSVTNTTIEIANDPTFVRHVASVVGVDNNGQLVRSDPSTDFMAAPGGLQFSPASLRPHWLPPTASPTLQTYFLAYGITMWVGLRPQQISLTRPYDALISIAFSASSLDAFLRQIVTTPNAILALIDGHTGVVVASSAPNSSVVWPTQFPAVGNPNAMLSAAAAQILALYSSGSANDTTSFGQITDRISQRFSFSFGSDTVHCSTNWIVDDATMLSLVLVLVVPDSDILGTMATTTRNSIIFVALFTSLAFG